MNKNLLFILLFFNQILFGEGFIAGTLVKTTNGYIGIDQLKENDTVLSLDFKKQEIVEGKVTKVYKITLDSFFELCFNNRYLYVAPDHKVFLSI